MKKIVVFVVFLLLPLAMEHSQTGTRKQSSAPVSIESSYLTFVNIMDISPWRINMGENYLLVADYSDNIHMFDIQNPATPDEVGTFDSPSVAFKMVQIGPYLYVADRDSGLVIVDISNPAEPEQVGMLKPDIENYTMTVAVQGDYAYMSTRTYREPNFFVIDIHDPFAPSTVGSLTLVEGGAYYDLVARDHYVYNAMAFSDLEIVDVSDAISPQSVGIFNSGDMGETKGIAIRGDYVYIVDSFVIWGDDNIIFRIINVSDPTAPCMTGSYEIQSIAVKPSLALSGNYAYIGAGEIGVVILDTSNPENPTLVDTYDTPVLTKDIVIRDQYLYVSDLYSLLILRSSLISDVEEKEISIPADFKLEQNFPNPFNPSTEITYAIPQPVNVTLKIYNISGKEVATLVDSKKREGDYTVRWDASGFSSGLYLYKMTAGAYTQVKRMLLLK